MPAQRTAPPMTRIRATCPTCGEVELTATDLVLSVVGSTAPAADSTTYRFECPDCESLVVKPADTRISRLLTSGGVEVEYTSATRLDDELAALSSSVHPEHPTPGPRLTTDDLLDLHELLATDHWFDELRGSMTTLGG